MQQLDTPFVVPILKQNVTSSLPIKHIAAGSNHVLATSKTGKCFGWGDNSYA